MMRMLEVVDVATARGAPGVRIVVSGIVPSPCSEAAKGLFRGANERMAVAISAALRIPASRNQATSVGSSSVSSTTARRPPGIAPKRAS
jgi:hypothetical protein